VREGAEGQITGFQTNNRGGVSTLAELDSAFLNTFDNTDGVFLEIYEDVFWEANNQRGRVLPASGKTTGGWADEFHRRRVDAVFPNFARAGNPFPSSFSFTFQRAGTGAQTLYDVHGAKCGQGRRREFGQILVDAQPPAIRSAGGVATASAFGGARAAAPRTRVEIYGTNLAATTRSWAGGDFAGVNAPTGLDGTTVHIGGRAAYISYVSPTQINGQVPAGVPAAGTSAAFNLAVNSWWAGGSTWWRCSRTASHTCCRRMRFPVCLRARRGRAA